MISVIETADPVVSLIIIACALVAAAFAVGGFFGAQAERARLRKHYDAEHNEIRRYYENMPDERLKSTTAYVQLLEKVNDLEVSRQLGHEQMRELNQTIVEQSARIERQNLRIEELEQGINILSDQVLALDQVPKWPRRSAAIAAGERKPAVNTVKFQRELIDRCNNEELDQIIFNFGLKPDDIPGDTLSARATELVRYAIRHGQLHQLAAVSAELRPEGDWYE